MNRTFGRAKEFAGLTSHLPDRGVATLSTYQPITQKGPTAPAIRRTVKKKNNEELRGGRAGVCLIAGYGIFDLVGASFSYGGGVRYSDVWTTKLYYEEGGVGACTKNAKKEKRKQQ